MLQPRKLLLGFLYAQLQARLARNELALCVGYRRGRSLRPLKPTNE